MIFHIVLILIAFCGFLLSVYIRHKKVTKEVLVCPLGSDCDTVIFSGYSRFLGIPVELLGMAYYLAIVLAYGVFVVLPIEIPHSLTVSVFSLTILAFAFSLYLTAIQAFILKKWCTWCLISAGFCALILLFAVLIS